LKSPQSCCEGSFGGCALRWPIEPALASFMRDFYAIVQRRPNHNRRPVFQASWDLNVAAVRSSEVAQADIKDPALPSEGVPTGRYRLISTDPSPAVSADPRCCRLWPASEWASFWNCGRLSTSNLLLQGADVR
jgi:hypothetical protein